MIYIYTYQIPRGLLKKAHHPLRVATTGARQRLDELTAGHQLGHHIQGVEPHNSGSID